MSQVSSASTIEPCYANFSTLRGRAGPARHADAEYLEPIQGRGTCAWQSLMAVLRFVFVEDAERQDPAAGDESKQPQPCPGAAIRIVEAARKERFEHRDVLSGVTSTSMVATHAERKRLRGSGREQRGIHSGHA